MLRKRPSVKNLMIRRNAEIFKMLFQVTVHKASFPYRGFLELDSEISCCFERGGKMSSSMDTSPQFATGDDSDSSCDIVFNETLELVATLYKNKSKGTFQEKPACLVVRIKKKASQKGQMYQALGVAEVDLSSFADPDKGSAAPTQHSFPLTKSFIDGAFLYVTIVPKLMTTDSEVQDDTMSMQSGFSDAPVMSAEFGISSFPKYTTSATSPYGSLTSPEQVVEEEEDGEEESHHEEDVALELYKVRMELANLEEDNAQLQADNSQSREELKVACRSLEQLTAQMKQQLDNMMMKTDSARVSHVSLTRILAGASLSTDKDTITTLKEEIAALFEELEAQNQVRNAYAQSLQVKEARLAEAEVRNLHLMEKVTRLEERNATLKALTESSIPKHVYKERRKMNEDAFKRQITDLKSTKNHAERELERQVEVNHDLKRRLQLYSENIAELEVNGVANTNIHTFTEDSPTKRRTSQSQVGTTEAVKTVTYEGSLTKRGSFYPSWKNRHFILHGDSHLSYYTNQDDMVFKGHFIITAATVLGTASVSGYQCFYLEHSKRRLYMTAATTLEEMEWMAVFRRSISALNGSSSNVK